MRLFRNRPLATGCAVFIISMYVSYFSSDAVRILFVALSFASVAVAFIVNFRLKGKIIKYIAKYIAIPLALVLCGALSLFSFSPDEKREENLKGIEKEEVFVIKSTENKKSYGSKYIAYCEGEETKIILETNDGEIEDGDRIRAKVYFDTLETTNFGYNEYEQYIDDGIRLKAEAEEYEIISTENKDLEFYLRAINKKLDIRICESVNTDTYSIISALFLGNKDNLSSSMKRDFSRLGISHVVSLSGMHLALITALFTLFLSGIKINKKLKFVILECVVVFYTLVTGFSSSAMRSALMITLLYLLFCFGENPDTISSLFVSVSVILILFPYYIFSVSLILSFFAMIGCIVSSKMISGFLYRHRIRNKIIRYFVTVFTISVGVCLFTLPITCFKFGYFSIFSPFANIIIVPLFTLLLYISPFIVLFAKVPIIINVLAFVCEKTVVAIMNMTSFFAKFDFACVSFRSTTHTVGVIVITSFLILSFFLDRKRIRISYIGVCVGVLMFFTGTLYSNYEGNKNVSISVYNHSSSDIVSVESENKLVIFDISKPSKTNSSYAYSLTSYLDYTKIDTYVMCDYSTRMVNAIDYLSDKFYIDNVKIPKPDSEDEAKIANQMLELANRKNIKFSYIGENEIFGKATVSCMCNAYVPTSVKRAVAFSVEANGGKFSYFGASSFDVTENFAVENSKDSDIIVFGSYGPNFKNKYSCRTDKTQCVYYLGDSAEFAKDEFLRETSDKAVSTEEDVYKFCLKK